MSSTMSVTESTAARSTASSTKSKSKKNVSILSKRTKSDDCWDSVPVLRVSSRDLRRLNHTCVPFYLEKNGIIVNELQEEDDLRCSECSSSVFSAPSADAPSDDLLSSPNVTSSSMQFQSQSGRSISTVSRGISVPKFPLKLEHPVTLEELQAGLGGMIRTRNGYGFNFSHLDLSDKGLVDISVVRNFSELRSMDVSANYLRDVSVIGAMPYLQILNASKNELQVFGDFRSPLALQQVNFSRNKIYKIINLERLTQLTEVNLSHNNLSVAEGWGKCRHLRVLDLSHNQIFTILSLDCPSLVALFLHNNDINDIMNLTKCPNLRALSLAQNQIEQLGPLRNLTSLHELWLQSNKIVDLSELENLKPLLNLRRLVIEPNPFNSLGMWRRMLIFSLPQLTSVDGVKVTPRESVDAVNTFNPSYWKVSYENRMAVLLDRACQPATAMLDENIHSRAALPPVLLLVGAPMSNCYKLSTLLKQKFRNRIQLGGVHSTATTLEVNSTNKDIPVSFESFLQMKNRGEFLARSHILGRMCGFATSQITRASERGVVLVASVPIGIALSLRQMRMKATVILVMPSGRVNILKGPKEMTVTSVMQENQKLLQDQDSEATTESDDLHSSYWSEDVKRQTRTSIGFSGQKTVYDTAEPGNKLPALGARSGHHILRNKDKDESPDDLLDLPVNNTRKRESGAEPTEEAVGKEDKVVPELPKEPREQSTEATETSLGFNEGTALKAVENDVQSINNTYAIDFYLDPPPPPPLSRSLKSMAGSQPPPPQTTEGAEKEKEESQCSGHGLRPPFVTELQSGGAALSTVGRLQKLRRVASLFLDAGERSNLFKWLDSGASPEVLEKINWREALADLQLQTVQASNNSYSMSVNRARGAEGPRSREVVFNNCINNSGLQNVREVRTGDYDLVFMKLNAPRDPQTTADDPTMKCTQAFSSSSSAPANNKVLGAKSTFPLDAAGAPTRVDYCPVINPNYPFGPHQVCVSGGRGRPPCPHPICCQTTDANKGTFYQGELATTSFLDSPIHSYTSMGGLLDPDEWLGEGISNNYEAYAEGPFLEELQRARRLKDTSRFQSEKKCNRKLPLLTLAPGDEEEIPGEYYDFPSEPPPPTVPPPPPTTCSGFSKNPTSALPPPTITPSSPEDSDTEVEEEEGPRPHTNRKHRQTTEATILKIRESYTQFHHENPGFFSQVIDSTDIDSCVSSLSVVLTDLLSKSPQQNPNCDSFRLTSYANQNLVDAPIFKTYRMKEYRRHAESFSKGQPQLNIPPCPMGKNKSRKPGSPLHFQASRCPDNLFSPYIPRRPRMAKISKLIQ